MSELTEAQQRKLETWRRLVTACLWAAAAALVVEAILLVWPGASRTARLVGAGIFAELAVSAAVLGAVGKCPACGTGFEGPPGKLLPESCGRCGVSLGARRA
jgi:hypothetical protein